MPEHLLWISLTNCISRRQRGTPSFLLTFDMTCSLLKCLRGHATASHVLRWVIRDWGYPSCGAWHVFSPRFGWYVFRKLTRSFLLCHLFVYLFILIFSLHLFIYYYYCLLGVDRMCVCIIFWFIFLGVFICLLNTCSRRALGDTSFESDEFFSYLSHLFISFLLGGALNGFIFMSVYFAI